jgi:protoporphyrinogen oxidase
VDRWWDAALSPDHWLDHRRSTWVWIADRLIPYPLQLNLHRLSDLAREACLRGLLAAAADRLGGRPNFHDGILATFGEGIASHFLVPYNAKLWAHPLEQMSSQWIAHRVAVPNVADIVSRTAHGQNSSEGGPNATFRYPRRDGSGAVWKALARMLPPESIRYEDGVVRQDADRRIAHTVKGRKYRYDYLISSMPIDGLTGILENGGHIHNPIFSRRHRQGGPLAPRVDNHLAERDAYVETSCQLDTVSQAKTLTATATHVIGIGLEGRPPEVVQEKLWIYYPEPSVPFYRVTITSNLSAENTPRPGETRSLMAEVSEDRIGQRAAIPPRPPISTGPDCPTDGSSPSAPFPDDLVRCPNHNPASSVCCLSAPATRDSNIWNTSSFTRVRALQ